MNSRNTQLWDLLPRDTKKLLDASWALFAPYYQDLANRELTKESLEAWLLDWSHLSELQSEIETRLAVTKDLNTEDESAKKRFLTFQEVVGIPAETQEQVLRERLLGSKLIPQNFELPLRRMQVKASLFREVNLPLEIKEEEYAIAYSETIGTQTVLWNGEETTLPKLEQEFSHPDRSHREKAWKLASERQLKDWTQLNAIWKQILEQRLLIAANANEPDYRSYRWKEMQRLDYDPAHCKQFSATILQEIVPAATRIYDRHRKVLGVETLKPWDLIDGWYSCAAEPAGTSPLKPFANGAELAEKTENIFTKLDPDFGAFIKTMRAEGLLDLENRKGKSPGGYCTAFDVVRRPFIFMNAVGMHDDVQTALHEAGHAFHQFEVYDLPHPAQRDVSLEFAEVASMSMEMLGAPFLEKRYGGFYEPAEAARARIETLERIILFWPFMAVVDSFQHWVYENPKIAVDGVACDAMWDSLWTKYIPGVDYSGFEKYRASGWQRKQHIFKYPFYYVEYGMAQLCAQQIWKKSLSDPKGAIQNYRAALRLGGTKSLPELFSRAGGKFNFDSTTLHEVVSFAEGQIEKLRSLAHS